MSRKKPNESAGKMEITLDFANIWYKSFKSVAVSGKATGKASPSKKNYSLRAS